MSESLISGTQTIQGQTAQKQPTIRKTWVAFGENGAVASIHAVGSGYEVRPLDGRGGAGMHGTLEVAKRAITTQRSSSVTFEEH